MKGPIDIAREWLRKSYWQTLGDRELWTKEQVERYHTELGLLVEFVNDCWPKEPKEETK